MVQTGCMPYIIRKEPSVHQSTEWGLVDAPMRQRPNTKPSDPRLSTRWAHRHQANQREAVSLRICWRGGSEPLYMVTARGAMGLFSAHDYLHDVMREVQTGEQWYWDQPTML